MNKRQGITLVALVVTIIVLLILVGVTIALVLGPNGMITKAKQGKIEGRATALRDKVLIWHAENKVKSKAGEGIKTIEVFTTELKAQGLLENDEEVNDILEDRILVLATEGQDGFKVEVDFSGWELPLPNIGDIVIYDPRIGATSSQLTYTSYIGSAYNNVYDPGNGHSEQIFQVNENDIEWIVIGIENNQIKLMSKEVKKNINNEELKLKWGQGWLYAEEELHNICKIYGYGNGANKSKVTKYQIGNPYITGEIQDKEITGSGARSITIEDLQEMSNAKLTETNPKTSRPTNPLYMPSLDGVDDSGKCKDINKKNYLPHTYKNTYKNYFNIKPEYSNVLNDIFKEDSSYWLATRLLHTNYRPLGVSEGIAFRIGCVKLNEINYIISTTCSSYYSEFKSHSPLMGIRPIVYLEPGVSLNKIELGRWELMQ